MTCATLITHHLSLITHNYPLPTVLTIHPIIPYFENFFTKFGNAAQIELLH